ncbi:hypothetical protein UCRPC4_g00379 [Phaeomoniella chlamydospora]|uniref:Myb-like DNA-binding domain-containing protein n=1 Tax=Phaeomoniella chlamydospora TaxID=158046 RepID=A0A0G2H0E6_PHACM|nr:hypothetical protein UCRPC4_g00379 [Phaeomoniella chlamydospora]
MGVFQKDEQVKFMVKVLKHSNCTRVDYESLAKACGMKPRGVQARLSKILKENQDTDDKGQSVATTQTVTPQRTPRQARPRIGASSNTNPAIPRMKDLRGKVNFGSFDLTDNNDRDSDNDSDEEIDDEQMETFMSSKTRTNDVLGKSRIFAIKIESDNDDDNEEDKLQPKHNNTESGNPYTNKKRKRQTIPSSSFIKDEDDTKTEAGDSVFTNGDTFKDALPFISPPHSRRRRQNKFQIHNDEEDEENYLSSRRERFRTASMGPARDFGSGSTTTTTTTSMQTPTSSLDPSPATVNTSSRASIKKPVDWSFLRLSNQGV